MWGGAGCVQREEGLSLVQVQARLGALTWTCLSLLCASVSPRVKGENRGPELRFLSVLALPS